MIVSPLLDQSEERLEHLEAWMLWLRHLTTDMSSTSKVYIICPQSPVGRHGTIYGIFSKQYKSG